MKAEDLIALGFNRNEAKVYCSLARFGQADASQLIKDTKFHKNIVYDNLAKLIDKGLVASVIEGRKTLFKLANPNMLIQFFEEQEKELEEKKKSAIKIAHEIENSAKRVITKQDATVYRGVKGIKSFYNESLKGGDYVIFGAPKQSVEIMKEYFWKNYNAKRMKKKIKVRMIFNPSIREYGNSIKNKLTEIRYFDKDFEPLTETHIQDDKIGIIVWTEEPVLFLIQDKHVAESYRKFFEDMWKKSKA